MKIDTNKDAESGAIPREILCVEFASFAARLSSKVEQSWEEKS